MSGSVLKVKRGTTAEWGAPLGTASWTWHQVPGTRTLRRRGPTLACGGVSGQQQEQDFSRGNGTSIGMSHSSQCWGRCLGFAVVANSCVLLTEANLDYNVGLS